MWTLNCVGRATCRSTCRASCRGAHRFCVQIPIILPETPPSTVGHWFSLLHSLLLCFFVTALLCRDLLALLQYSPSQAGLVGWLGHLSARIPNSHTSHHQPLLHCSCYLLHCCLYMVSRSTRTLRKCCSQVRRKIGVKMGILVAFIWLGLLPQYSYTYKAQIWGLICKRQGKVATITFA